ncbi:MAG: 16S rRNA (uracil(1498)-N(3))-methyltransferase [Clostridia bacterium]|nr:16S rRNA (uracil(1498)-N(3))-methyltransferase [Clostridia bacterium]
MHRFFAERIENDRAELPPEEENHALRVLRLNAGDECQALVEGNLYRAVIEETAPQVILRLEDMLPSTEPTVEITLYQGIPKGEKMDFIAQKCTEAGVCRIVPVAFSRCVARWDGKDAAKKQARFQRIAAEAAKQSGRAVSPEMGLPITVKQLCAELSPFDLVLVPWEEERGNGIRMKWRGEKRVAFVIGPEGGISAEEIEQMKAAGAAPVSLGPRIFRTETAGLAAIVSLLTISGDME